MNKRKKIYIALALSPFGSVFLLIALILLTTQSSNGNASGNPVNSLVDFIAPFSDDVTYTISSSFGNRMDPFTNQPSFHSGIDLCATDGTPIVASANGVVWETAYDRLLGRYVKIEHDVNGQKYCTTYGHMIEDSVVVSKDEPVERGQKIGIIGSSGQVTGRHVHFMITSSECKYGKANLFNPQEIIDADLVRRKQMKNDNNATEDGTNNDDYVD